MFEVLSSVGMGTISPITNLMMCFIGLVVFVGAPFTWAMACREWVSIWVERNWLFVHIASGLIGLVIATTFFCISQ